MFRSDSSDCSWCFPFFSQETPYCSPLGPPPLFVEIWHKVRPSKVGITSPLPSCHRRTPCMLPPPCGPPLMTRLFLVYSLTFGGGPVQLFLKEIDGVFGIGELRLIYHKRRFHPLVPSVDLIQVPEVTPVQLVFQETLRYFLIFLFQRRSRPQVRQTKEVSPVPVLLRSTLFFFFCPKCC